MIRRVVSVLACLAALAACSPGLPKGVSQTDLDAALDDKVGDLNTCVLIAKAGDGDLVYRYGTHVACGTSWPTCLGTSLTTADAQLPPVVRSKSVSNLSCLTKPDGSRSVAWASGLVEGHSDLVYVAVMEGTTTPPGMVVAEHLASAFRSAGF